MRGLEGWYLYEITLWLDAGSLLRHGFRNRFKCHLLQSNRHELRNRLKCHLLQMDKPYGRLIDVSNYSLAYTFGNPSRK